MLLFAIIAWISVSDFWRPTFLHFPHSDGFRPDLVTDVLELPALTHAAKSMSLVQGL